MKQRAGHLTDEYREMLETLSEGSVHVHFDPYEDIDWDASELAVDRQDPRWILDPELDPLGAHPWYRAQPQAVQIEIGRRRTANVVKVGSVFESALIRGLMQYAMTLPNGSPEFRYCMHEMTEECNHIQMFQELVNRIGEDVPGPRPLFRRLVPFLGYAGGFMPLAFMIGILGGEEPIDHYQKALIRSGNEMPPLMARAMQIHIAEEARHISFADAFLRFHLPRQSRPTREFLAVLFPVLMAFLCDAITRPSYSLFAGTGLPREVYREALVRGSEHDKITAGYFNDMRKLCEETGLMTGAGKRMWKRLGIYGEPSRYRGEPDR
ncbi:MAG TPA: diiron oxygenase, partial [Solirubrobacteraceae bacterium]|nr:diiron oxygenase [Solirubrobacteraceae bacterium]